MKRNKTKGLIAIKAKEELLCEANKAAQHFSLNVEEKYSWMDAGSGSGVICRDGLYRGPVLNL